MSSVSSIPRVMILQMCNWFGAPRLPRAFRRAGFHVTTFGFPGLLMQRVQCVDESLLVSESISRDELVAALLDAMEHCRADLVIPTDDTTILLLHTAAMVARRSGRSASVHATLQRSLGNATYLKRETWPRSTGPSTCYLADQRNDALRTKLAELEAESS